MTLQLQPGKWYRQRDGGKAYVAAEVPVDAATDFAFVGVDCERYPRRWNCKGTVLMTSDSRDLVAEWVDEPTDAEIAEAVRWYMGFEDKVGLKFCTCIRKTPRDFVDAVRKYREREGA